MTLKTETGKEIRKVRKEKKITLRDLSEITKVDFFYLGKIERGQANTTLDTIEKLADGLGKKATLNLE